jgi:hypothetical protein
MDRVGGMGWLDYTREDAARDQALKGEQEKYS